MSRAGLNELRAALARQEARNALLGAHERMWLDAFLRDHAAGLVTDAQRDAFAWKLVDRYFLSGRAADLALIQQATSLLDEVDRVVCVRDDAESRLELLEEFRRDATGTPREALAPLAGVWDHVELEREQRVADPMADPDASVVGVPGAGHVLAPEDLDPRRKGVGGSSGRQVHLSSGLATSGEHESPERDDRPAPETAARVPEDVQ